MAKTRLMLQDQLERLLGSTNVYFSPPSGLRMNYPCIRYELTNADSDSADNIPYIFHKRYSLTYIDKDPDSDIPDQILFSLPYCSLDRCYRADKLYHHVYTLYW